MSIRTITTVLASSLLGGIFALLVQAWLTPPPSSRPYDAAFAHIGLDYPRHLGIAYASAWEDGATRLECGASPSAAIAAVGREWDANRAFLFDRMLTAEFARIIPEQQPDAEVSPSQRDAMARAWRGFARGLRGLR